MNTSPRFQLYVAVYMQAAYNNELDRQSIRRTRIQSQYQLNDKLGRLQMVRYASYGRGVPLDIRREAQMHLGQKQYTCGHRYHVLKCEGVEMCSDCYYNDHIRTKLLGRG